jgi:hypothetical protein
MAARLDGSSRPWLNDRKLTITCDEVVPERRPTQHRYDERQFLCICTGFVSDSNPVDAPNNGNPWYKSCTAQALAKGAGTTVLDAIGIIPEGGTISAAFSLWHGAAGVSNGIKIQGRVAFAGGLVSTIFATNDLQGSNGVDASSVVSGLQAVAGGAGVAKGLAEDIPVAGQVIAAGATALDLIGTGLEVAKCYP